MGERFDVVCCSVVVLFGLGCAQGAPEPDGLSGPIVLGTADAAITAAPPVVDAGSPMSPPSAPPFTGTACKMGDQVACTCMDGTKGSQLCHFDAASPTMGALGSCDGCKAMMTSNAGSGAAGMGSAGAGSGGRSGTFGGSGAAGSRAAGSGGSASAGSGGSTSAGSGGTASAGSGGSSSAGSGAPDAGAMTCDPDKCPDPGGLRRACCTDDGQCGGRLLGNCSVRN